MDTNKQVSQTPFGSFQISDAVLQNFAEGLDYPMQDEAEALRTDPSIRSRYARILAEVSKTDAWKKRFPRARILTARPSLPTSRQSVSATPIPNSKWPKTLTSLSAYRYNTK